MFELIDWMTQPVGLWGHVAQGMCVAAAAGMAAGTVRLAVAAHGVDRAHVKAAAPEVATIPVAETKAGEVVEAKILPFLPRDGFAPAEPVVTEDRFPALAQMLELEAARRAAALEGHATRTEVWPPARRANGLLPIALGVVAFNNEITSEITCEITSETE
ncbi:hypothetical protein [Pseudoxanthomonas sp. UTMC 1351]|uniref:hypothetical protein n=1 Tax=Pseudoxanthomonas sp. UTMC 1351 TaxID=2695853 RepID=UPI0034CF5FFD